MQSYRHSFQHFKCRTCAHKWNQWKLVRIRHFGGHFQGLSRSYIHACPMLLTFSCIQCIPLWLLPAQLPYCTYSKGKIEPLQRFGRDTSLRDLGVGCRSLGPKWRVGLFQQGITRIERQVETAGSNRSIRYMVFDNLNARIGRYAQCAIKQGSNTGCLNSTWANPNKYFPPLYYLFAGHETSGSFQRLKWFSTDVRQVYACICSFTHPRVKMNEKYPHRYSNMKHCAWKTNVFTFNTTPSKNFSHTF